VSLIVTCDGSKGLINALLGLNIFVGWEIEFVGLPALPMIGLKDGDISESVKSFLTGVLDAPKIIITINKYLDDAKKCIIKDVYQFCPH
jgi:hypothetical protein